MFDADRPIINSQQDRLNRSPFAIYLARCLLDHVEPQSLVVGLFGTWGVGKTSVVNLIIEELNVAASNMLEDEKPIVLNFSPWSYSGQNQLIYSFFRRLSSVLRSVPNLENGERIIYLLELYVSFFTHQPIPKALRTKKWFGKKEDAYAWESGRDLTQVKAELNELLRTQKHKLIIIIDNISQLYDEEIKQIFQIVKSMGDYANTTYLLAMDKEHVIQAINRLDGDGEDLLAKIVQLPFEVPPISPQDLEVIFADRLSHILANTPTDTWQIEYWANMYYGAIKYFFHHCRDITHYANILHFGFSRMRDIVNPMDFFALTALEVFEPIIYENIRENKDLFSDLLDHVYVLNEDERQKDQQRCDDILAQCQCLAPDMMLNLLMQLFPRIRRVYEPNEPFYHSDRLAGKLKRVCSPEFFDIYFRLSIPTTQMHEIEFKTILSFAADNAAFDQALTRLNQDGRILSFLDHLDNQVISAIPLAHTQTIVNALLDIGDLLPPGASNALSLSTPLRIHRILHELFKKYADRQDRFLILQNAIAAATKSIYSIVHELIEQAHEHSEESDTFLPLEFRDLAPDQLTSLQKLAVNRIENWATSNRLMEHPKLLPLLFAWREWAQDTSCEAFVKKMTDTDKGLVIFLQAVLAEPIIQAMTRYEKNPAWIKYLADIDAFIPHQALEARARQLFEDGYFEKLREREQLALMIFLDLIQAKTDKLIPGTSV